MVLALAYDQKCPLCPQVLKNWRHASTNAAIGHSEIPSSVIGACIMMQ